MWIKKTTAWNEGGGRNALNITWAEHSFVVVVTFILVVPTHAHRIIKLQALITISKLKQNIQLINCFCVHRRSPSSTVSWFPFFYYYSPSCCFCCARYDYVSLSVSPEHTFLFFSKYIFFRTCIQRANTPNPSATCVCVYWYVYRSTWFAYIEMEYAIWN